MMYINGQAVAPTYEVKTGADWTKLKEISGNGTSSFSVPFTAEELNTYNYFLIEGDINLSTATWLYINSGSTTIVQGWYFERGGTSANHYDFTSEDAQKTFLFEKNYSTNNRFFTRVNKSGSLSNCVLDLSQSLYFIAYSGKITATSNITIYGATTIGGV